MSTIVEIDERGAIHLPNDLLAAIKPHTRFMLEIQGTTLILHPEDRRPSWAVTSPAERAKAVRRWASLERPSAPVLADEVLRREQMYS